MNTLVGQVPSNRLRNIEFGAAKSPGLRVYLWHGPEANHDGCGGKCSDSTKGTIGSHFSLVDDATGSLAPMTVEPSLVVSILALSGAVIAYLMGDSRSKGKVDTLEPKVTTLEKRERDLTTLAAKLEERAENLANECARIDREKAGLETVNAVTALLREMKADFASTLHEMKADIDRRFDRLERLERGNRDAE